MNIKDLLGPLLLAVGLTVLFRSFWGWYQGPQTDVGFVAPLSKVEQEPLYLEVDFEDDQKKNEEVLTKVSTDHANYTFSNHGAALTDLQLTRSMDGQKQVFSVLGTPPALEREMRPFLVALDEKTPYYYTFKAKNEKEDRIEVVYEVKSDRATIEKTFTVYKDRHELGIGLTITPRGNESVRTRLIWPSPFLQAIQDEEVINALSVDVTGKFVKTAEKNLDPRAGFFNPSIFGTEDKYFINSLVSDTNGFAKRAYYKSIDRRLLSFLEAQEITKEATWNMSFYIGPKEWTTIRPVNAQLEKALDYGFFSPIAKGMLYLLNLLNKYLHNYGFAILLITLLLKLLLLPFTFSGQQKMKKMQEYQKKLAYIQQRFKNDPEGLNQAREELIRKHGLPGVGGCLPLFLQIPFFIGLYSALNNSIELYRAPFIFWIKDLSIPDPYFILPLLVAISAFLGSVSAQDQKAGFKQVFIAFAISAFLGAWTSYLAAGLVLFIFANAFLHFLQTKGQQALGL